MSNDKIRDASDKADALYSAGYEARKQERDYDPQGCKEWQNVVDALAHHQAESEPVGVFGFERKTSNGTREFQGYLCNEVPEPRNGDLLYLGPQPAAQVPERLREVIDFLLGVAPLDGIWFGDGIFSKNVVCRKGGTFWWRKNLSDAVLAAPSIADKREPIKLKDRLPTKDDEDCEGRVWLFWDESYGDDRVTRATVEYVRFWHQHPDMLAWIPTGLRRPEPPEVQP
jgi:hypothetical protein